MTTYASDWPEMKPKTMTLAELRLLAKTLRKTAINRIEINGKGWSVRMARVPTVPVTLPSVEPAEPPNVIFTVCAPLPGKLLLRHPLLDACCVTLEKDVQVNDVLGFIKVGVVYIPLRSTVSGTVVAVEFTDEQQVEYGSEIFRIRTSTGL
ncbi:acetyl-CoA carboxylase biotin carboxyl carrier protein [Pectobacterium atrosepticum]|uniref:acetyl-CoA carboxylase biotin carboxyl carrier protein n=1 Tax=Pectobacterium atrosepticum TaxID=29471 RepID=UPI0011870F78|nr:acetyl-CoA carboxylase [Pectobacterium atrosepticum]